MNSKVFEGIKKNNNNKISLPTVLWQHASHDQHYVELVNILLFKTMTQTLCSLNTLLALIPCIHWQVLFISEYSNCNNGN